MTRRLFVLAIFFLLSRYVEGVIFFNVINAEKNTSERFWSR